MSFPRYMLKVMVPSLLIILLMNTGSYFVAVFMETHYGWFPAKGFLAGLVITGPLCIAGMCLSESKKILHRWFDFVDDWGNE